MKIIVDTREPEKTQLIFNSKYISEVIRRKLDVGDYACILEDGHEVPFIFDRKSLGDLRGTLTNGRKGDKKEYDRLLKEISENKNNKSKLKELKKKASKVKPQPQNYTRFKREMQRAKKSGIHLFLIIEKSYTKVGEPYKYGQRDSQSIIKQVQTLHIRYGLTPIFCTTRSEMAKYITDFFIAYGEDYVKRMKEAKKKESNVKTKK